MTDAAPWAGGRIILLGDYAEDLPNGLLSESERLEWSLEHGKNMEDALPDDEDPLECEEYNSTSLYNIADDDFAKVARKQIYYGASLRLNDTETKTLDQLCFDDSTMSENSPDRVWILRNLSKHEYVRADTLRSVSPKIVSFGPFLEPVGFGDVIMARLQWTSDPSGLFYGGCQGPWAGDRFDIITLDKLVLEPEGENKWKDVSSMALRAFSNNHCDFYSTVL